ncbi:hypothetical protein [Deinococcus koreensis]|uniref:hypothetical protein n=1 Tax=Deinococcus koreensis TaxID=2054903 RepID=UPI001057017E|nr:hypothetical protein [Deinococcus koreensis]
MTPEEWKTGIENEAASVEDGEWEREARRSGRVLHFRSRANLMAAATLIYVVLGTVMTAGFNALSLSTGVSGQPYLPALALGGLALPCMIAYQLTERNIRPFPVRLVHLVSTLLLSLLARVVTLPMPTSWSGAIYLPMDLLPSIPVEIAWPQLGSMLLINTLAVTLGIGLAHLSRYWSEPNRPRHGASHF